MEETPMIEKLMEMIANQNNLITALTARVVALEDNISVDGVYLDGVPEYAKMYIQAPEKKEV